MALQTRQELVKARNVLVRWRASAADADEIATSDAALEQLNDAIETVDAASLLQAANIVALSTDALERVVASARPGLFNSLQTDIVASIGKLQNVVIDMQAVERLPRAIVDDDTVRGVFAAPVPQFAPPVLISPAEVSAPNDALPRPIDSRNFAELKDEYASYYDRCRLRPEFAGNVDFYVSRLIKAKATYQQIGGDMGIPWFFIGVVHGMECGFNFGTHLHNGDPLSARTVRVPAGRPPTHEPPFSWLESAMDALTLQRLDEVTDWSLPRALYQLEAYNGFGYRRRGVPSPYLWSFSTIYNKGKFVSDGAFDPNAVSKQCGAAVMLRSLHERGSL